MNDQQRAWLRQRAEAELCRTVYERTMVTTAAETVALLDAYDAQERRLAATERVLARVIPNQSWGDELALARYVVDAELAKEAADDQAP